MQHTNTCKIEGWVNKGYEYAKDAQIKMIKKMHPHYNSEKDYILWIIADMFYPFLSDRITGELEIKKKNGEIIPLSLKINKPYPNKQISQITAVAEDKRKRIYGVPLLFHSYDELTEICEISIKWTVYGELAGNALINRTQILYQVEFEQDTAHPEYRTYTVFSKDYLNKMEKHYEFQDYENEFEIYINADSRLIIKKEAEKFKIECATESVIDKKNNSGAASQEEQNIIKMLMKDIPDINVVKEVFTEEKIHYMNSYKMQKEILKAEFMADIIPEPVFGF